MEDKECCKWCYHCFVTDLENNKGKCCRDDYDTVKLTDDGCCDYCYDDDLNRC